MQTNVPSLSKWLRRLTWLVGAVALMWGLGWLAGPALIRGQVEKIASEQLGRKVTLGAVDFKPWTLELTLSDLAIADQAGSRTQFGFKRLYVNAELESLLRLAPVVDAMALDAPVLRLTHLGGGKYDIDDIVARFDKPPTDKPSEPAHFALFNLVLAGGAVEFEDRPVGRTHALTGLDLGVPFISNLPARHEIKVEPRLAFNLNGSRFDSQAQTTPFAVSRKTDARLDLRDLDLAPYLPYLPQNLPLRLQKGVLAATLQLKFEQTPQAQVQLQGELQLRDVKATDASGNDMLGFESFKVVLADVRPFEQSVKLSSVELVAPQVLVSRDAAGRLNLESGAASAAPSAPAAATSQAAPTAPPPGWKAEIARLVIQGGGVQWTDAAVAPQARIAAQGVSLEVRDILWPMDKPASFEGSLAIVDASQHAARAKGPAKAPMPAQLKFTGTATDRQASVKASVTDLALGMATPYLAQFLNPVLQGRLRSELDIEWKAPDLKVAVGSLVVDDLALAAPNGAGGTAWPSVRQISLGQTQIDLARRSVAVGKLAIVQPRVAVSRAPDKRWMFEDWLKAGDRAAAAPVSAKAGKPGAGAAAAQAPWGVVISDLVLSEGDLVFRDEAMGKPVSFGLSAIRLQVKDLRPEGSQPVAMQLSARIKSERAEPGQLDYRGNVQWQPVVAQGALVATQIPVHAFEPYFAGAMNIELLRADAGFKGELRYAEGASGPTVQVKGDAVVEDFRANSLAASEGGLRIAEELLNWKALSLRGIDLALAPGAAPRVSITETTLADFFARVIVQETGRINLQNLVRSEPEAAAPVPAASAPVASVPAAAATSVAQTAPAASAPVVAAAPTGLEPVITIGPVGLINGKVFFSDRFVKPNYSANLSELTGKLSAFSSVAPQGQPQLADLELRGRAEGTASLEILGKVNPLATPLALDIRGIVRDLELAPLSPYSVKYAGHGIERGKLSVDVAYLVLPNGQLTASNKVVLNQLTFGDKVEGATASLPVKLAVALLADRNGVIDINLPISGSLNDPQFRLGPIIFKVIVNLVVKAITAPFSLLASAFGGGGDELSTVAFAPGSAALLPQAREGLDKVAKALNDRPSLKMTVVGTASLEAEREAYKQERLRALLVAEKRRSMLAGNATAVQAGATLTVSETEVPVLLKEVYQRADITKPRNLAGVAQEIPLPEMQALLLANIDVTQDAMRDLAVQRGVAVKDYLSGQKLPVERLFLGAVKPVANDPKWTPRAELNLGN